MNIRLLLIPLGDIKQWKLKIQDLDQFVSSHPQLSFMNDSYYFLRAETSGLGRMVTGTGKAEGDYFIVDGKWPKQLEVTQSILDLEKLWEQCNNKDKNILVLNPSMGVKLARVTIEG